MDLGFRALGFLLLPYANIIMENQVNRKKKVLYSRVKGFVAVYRGVEKKMETVMYHLRLGPRV